MIPKKGRYLIICESWWRRQMEIFSALLAFCAGNSPVPGPRWILRTKASDAELLCFLHLICTWINSSVNNPEAGDLRRHRAHCDVSVMNDEPLVSEPMQILTGNDRQISLLSYFAFSCVMQCSQIIAHFSAKSIETPQFSHKTRKSSLLGAFQKHLWALKSESS